MIVNDDIFPFLETWTDDKDIASLKWMIRPDYHHTIDDINGNTHSIWLDHPVVLAHKELYPHDHVGFAKNPEASWEWVEPLRKSPKKFFYVQIYTEHAFVMFPIDGWARTWLDDIKQNKVHLHIQCNAHGYHSIIDTIYDEIIIKHGVDPKNITFSSESADMAEHLEIVSYRRNLPKINLQWHVEFEYLQQVEISQGWFGDRANTLQDKEYPKKFLSFNGLYRIHRAVLIYLLSAKNLLDKGLVSYNVKEPVLLDAVHENGENAVLESLFHAFIYNKDIRNALGAPGEKDRSHYPNRLEIESQDNKNYHAFHVTPNHIEFYENTYFSVVTETSFPSDRVNNHYEDLTDTGRILSEKIFKPISMKHPFIIVTNPGALSLLRDIGYRTFHPLIDETYDKIRDPGVRMLMIVNEIEKLCNLEGEALTRFLTEAKEICEFNFAVMKNKKNFWYPIEHVQSSPLPYSFLHNRPSN